MSSREHIQQRLASAVGDRYDVLDWIGGGGMAGVYLARHRIHGGFCAIKVLAEHYSHDENLVASFMQEARTAASLEGHPHIVRILDIAANDGLYYLIMNFIEGEDVSSYLERTGHLSPIETASVIWQVADALAWAHERGVVHRDLKPANIRLDSRGQVVVMDFGIAKVGETPSALTQMGATVGTPYYMSPEQIMGSGVDARSDLYALGVIGYQLVTGKRPFEGANHQAIWHAHQTETPTPVQDLVPDIPKALAFVIHRLLEKDPARRYQSASDAAEHLERIVKTAPPVKLTPRLGKQLDEWRATAPPTSSLTQPPASAAPPASEATMAMSPPPEQSPDLDPPPQPAARAPEQPSGQAAPENKRKSGLLPILVGAIALLTVLIAGVAYVGFSGDSEEAPPIVEQPPPLANEIETSTGLMTLAPAGPAVIGDDEAASAKDWNPRREVELPAFYVDRTEVTNASYKAFCDATSRAYPPDPPDDPGYFESKPGYPAVNVSYRDAEAYAAWAGKRLPTNAEWERAARGSDGRVYPWGDDAATAKQANVDGDADGYASHAPADSLPLSVSPSGALHMSGNVWEMTSDEFRPSNFQMFLEDMRMGYPDAGEEWISIRGGSFLSPADDVDLQLFSRAGWPANLSNEFIGFRCVLDADQAGQ